MEVKFDAYDKKAGIDFESLERILQRIRDMVQPPGYDGPVQSIEGLRIRCEVGFSGQIKSVKASW